MIRGFLFQDTKGQEFEAEFQIDEGGPAFQRLVNRMANRARGSKRMTATLGDGAIKMVLKPLAKKD